MWVILHGGIIASQTGGPALDGTLLWPMFGFGFAFVFVVTQVRNTVSYALLESAIRPDIQPKSSRSHKAEPIGIWMTKGG